MPRPLRLLLRKTLEQLRMRISIDHVLGRAVRLALIRIVKPINHTNRLVFPFIHSLTPLHTNGERNINMNSLA